MEGMVNTVATAVALNAEQINRLARKVYQHIVQQGKRVRPTGTRSVRIEALWTLETAEGVVEATLQDAGYTYTIAAPEVAVRRTWEFDVRFLRGTPDDLMHLAQRLGLPIP